LDPKPSVLEHWFLLLQSASQLIYEYPQFQKFSLGLYRTLVKQEQGNGEEERELREELGDNEMGGKGRGDGR
jgi:hypothetical protein